MNFMKGKSLLLIMMAGAALCACATRTSHAIVKEEPTLKSVLGDKFLIGVAMNTFQSSGRDTNGVNIVKNILMLLWRKIV